MFKMEREERKDERFTITSILARRIAMGWGDLLDHHDGSQKVDVDQNKNDNSDDDVGFDNSDDNGDIISYGATREEEEDTVSISSRFLITITTITITTTIIKSSQLVIVM